jgi:hypothetical protein
MVTTQNLSKSEIALKVINKYLVVFDKPIINDLKDLPQIEKSLFEKEELKKVVNDHIEDLKNEFGAKQISYYDRDRLKNYPFIMFKKLMKENKLPLKAKKPLINLGNGNFKQKFVYSV